MKLALVSLFALSLWAQTTNVVLTGPATARPGDLVTLTLSATGTTDTGTSGFQWLLTPPLGYMAVPTVGAAAKAAGKTLYCSVDNLTCLVVDRGGLGVIGNGAMVTYQVFQVPVTAAKGPVSFGISAKGATPTGTLQPAVLGAPYSLNVLARRQDLNGDGSIDLTDVTAMINECITSAATPAACTDDQNGDGKCDVLDVVLVIRAVGQ